MTSSEGCNLEPQPDLGHLLGVCRESARPKNQKKQWARYNLTISPEYWLNVPLRFKVFGSQLLFGIRGTAVRCSWFFSWSCLRFKPSVAELRFSLFEYRHAEIQHSYLGSNKSRICTTVIPKQDRHLNTVYNHWNCQQGTTFESSFYHLYTHSARVTRRSDLWFKYAVCRANCHRKQLQDLCLNCHVRFLQQFPRLCSQWRSVSEKIVLSWKEMHWLYKTLVSCKVQFPLS